jgi:hypothetical protein
MSEVEVMVESFATRIESEIGTGLSSQFRTGLRKALRATANSWGDSESVADLVRPLLEAEIQAIESRVRKDVAPPSPSFPVPQMMTRAATEAADPVVLPPILPPINIQLDVHLVMPPVQRQVTIQRDLDGDVSGLTTVEVPMNGGTTP